MKRATTYNIICFGFLPWSNLWKRNQSMMAEMSKFDFINRLIFVSPLVPIRSLLIRKNSSLNATAGISSKLFPSKITPLNILPYRKYLNVLKRIVAKIMLKIIRRLNNHKPFILFMNCPDIFSNYILDELLKDTVLSIFDFSDDFMELVTVQKSREEFNFNITRYARAANIVLTVNDHVKQKYDFLNKNIHVLRNATNYSNFDRNSFKPVKFLAKIKNGGKKIIGYSGSFNMYRTDCNLLDFLLEKRPCWEFVFIGPAESLLVEKYSRFNNFHYILPVDYQSLPDYTRYFDVAIVPFKINEHTKGNDLLKLHDFLAMGKPVVSTGIGGANDLKDVIRIAQRPSDFLKEIENALLNDNQGDVLKRKNTALKNSWHNRIKELEQLMKNFLGI